MLVSGAYFPLECPNIRVGANPQVPSVSFIYRKYEVGGLLQHSNAVYYDKMCHNLLSLVFVVILCILSLSQDIKTLTMSVLSVTAHFLAEESNPLGHRLLRDNPSKPLCLLRHTEGAALFPHSVCRFELRTHLYGDIHTSYYVFDLLGHSLKAGA